MPVLIFSFCLNVLLKTIQISTKMHAFFNNTHRLFFYPEHISKTSKMLNQHRDNASRKCNLDSEQFDRKKLDHLSFQLYNL